MAHAPDRTTTQSNDGSRISVWLTGDPVHDSAVLADALARTGVLLNVDSALMAAGEAGALRSAGRDVLQELAERHLVGRQVINHGTMANPDYVIERVAVGLTEQILRNMLHGQDLRKGMPLPGGSLAERVPKVFSVPARQPAQPVG